MAAKHLELEVVTPERKLLQEKIESIIVPAAEGSLGILPNHAPLISGLQIGEVKYTQNGETKRLAISGGFLEVAGNKVTILADTAEKAENIDLKRAQNAKERAEERLSAKDNIDVIRAELALKRAINRMLVSGKKF